jgi:hypothetical protein
MKKLLIIGFLALVLISDQAINAGPAFEKAIAGPAAIDKDAIANEVKGTINADKLKAKIADTFKLSNIVAELPKELQSKQSVQLLIDQFYKEEVEGMVESTYKEKERTAELDYIERLQILAIWFDVKFNLYSAQINLAKFKNDQRVGKRFLSMLNSLTPLLGMIKITMERKYPLDLAAINELDKELPTSLNDEQSIKTSFTKLKSYYSELYNKIKPLQDKKEKISASDPQYVALEYIGAK